MKKAKLLILVIGAIFLMAGCTVTTNIKFTQPGVTLKIKDKAYAAGPVKDDFAVTTFGSYEFVAEKEGHEPVYGIIPLRLNGDYLLVDIIFFAPACFINLFGVYPYYEIDMDKSIIRYSTDNVNWSDLYISNEESAYAKKYYEKLQDGTQAAKKKGA